MNADRICSFEDCGDPVHCKDYCRLHYNRSRKRGSPYPPVKRSAVEAWWAKWDRDASGCWVWNAGRDRLGYGSFRKGLAHRWGYMTLVGPIPEGLVLDHLCRNRACVNPSHLEPVTQQENCQRGLGGRLYPGMSHCRNEGHEMTPENSYRLKNGVVTCLICKRTKDRRAATRMRARRKAQGLPPR